MADLAPFYRITDCCSVDGNFVDVFININTITPWQDGIYSRPFILGDLVINSSFTLEADKTYLIIEGSGPTAASLPTIDQIEINLEEAAPPAGFDDCSQASVEIPCTFLYFIEPCCLEYGGVGPAAAQVNLINIDFNEVAEGTFVYTGPSQGPTPIFPTQLINGACYTITRNQRDTLLTEVVDFDLFTPVVDCEDVGCSDCPTLPGIHYLAFEPCCDGDTVYVQAQTLGGTVISNPDGQLEGSGKAAWAPSGGTNSNTAPIVDISSYLGVHQILATNQVSNIQGINVGQCYTVSLGTVGDGVISINEYLSLPLAPYQSQLSEEILDCTTAPCPDCNPITYSLTNCEGVSISSTTDLSAYLDTYVELENIDGCWLVGIYEPQSGVFPELPDSKGKAAFPILTPLPTSPIAGVQNTPVTVVGPCAEECPCACYEVIGYRGSYNYIDCETGKSLLVFSSGADKFCAATRPNIVGKEGIDYTLVISDCVDGECVEKCFLLTNCDPTAYPDQDATLNSTLQSLSQYANTNEVVVLSGYDGCWIVTETEECDCPVDVTVIRDYRDCEECLGITAYKLSNCEKINEVVYTLQDFSAYVGQVIKDDCNCWTVEEINYQPPSETTIVDPIVFEDCNTCLATYYTLTDCDDSESVIISSTNLSPYVGQVVKIEGCDPCYEVALYEDTAAPALWEEVTVTEASATCFECKQLVPRCSTVFNNSTEDRTFTYINANGDSEETEIVKSGHFSLRTCVQYWDEPDTFIYNYYGDCTVYEYDNTPLPGECNCIDVSIETGVGITVYSAVHTGEFFNDVKVFDLIISGVEYKIWGNAIGGWGISTVVGTTQDEIGFIKTGILDCPVADNTVWTVSGDLPGGVVVLSISTLEGTCATITTKEGHCVQYFPNNRKVRPGYNTPICSADKYDKITCNAADIMYKKVLELRYGISDCCPEENEKWLIKKELIELQALTDPNYTCDPLTDCCGQRVSSCSCNS